MDVMIIEASIGEVKFKPVKNNIWFVVTPSKPQSANIFRSFLSMRSFINVLTIQNNKLARKIRINTNAVGPILCGMMPLATK